MELSIVLSYSTTPLSKKVFACPSFLVPVIQHALTGTTEKAERVREEVLKRYPNTQIATEISPAGQFFK